LPVFVYFTTAMQYNLAMKSTNECLIYFSTHAWLKRQFAKLSESDKAHLRFFLDLNITDKASASLELTRFFLTLPPCKNKLIIDELLSCAISFRFS